MRFWVIGGVNVRIYSYLCGQNVELSNGAAEDQSDMMITKRCEEKEKGTLHYGCGDPRTCCKVQATILKSRV